MELEAGEDLQIRDFVAFLSRVGYLYLQVERWVLTNLRMFVWVCVLVRNPLATKAAMT